MKITKHITLFYLKEKTEYINKIIDETNQYGYITDIFIHTNVTEINKDTFHEYTNGTITFLYHDLSNIDPYFLTWKSRDLMKEQKDIYDAFIYIEDDILVPFTAIQYWVKYNTKLIDHNYNLGFVRIETNAEGVEYITDLWKTDDVFIKDPRFEGPIERVVVLDGETFALNSKNPYCAFWIYNKDEFHKFVNSKYYDINNVSGYDMRAASAVGLHGLETEWYKGTLIPLVEGNKLAKECKIYHLSNRFVIDASSPFATIRFEDAVELTTP
jgi:hypothetical protein